MGGEASRMQPVGVTVKCRLGDVMPAPLLNHGEEQIVTVITKQGNEKVSAFSTVARV